LQPLEVLWEGERLLCDGMSLMVEDDCECGDGSVGSWCGALAAAQGVSVAELQDLV